jgi:hypothetical protein
MDLNPRWAAIRAQFTGPLDFRPGRLSARNLTAANVAQLEAFIETDNG